eukprot:m.75153 g.75153  ORF g.75153 m.75153 type:complete len:364 (+) comp8473_c0_seq2:47-1138(+)
MESVEERRGSSGGKESNSNDRKKKMAVVMKKKNISRKKNKNKGNPKSPKELSMAIKTISNSNNVAPPPSSKKSRKKAALLAALATPSPSSSSSTSVVLASSSSSQSKHSQSTKQSKPASSSKAKQKSSNVIQGRDPSSLLRGRNQKQSAAQRLKGSKFRMLNEMLYTTTGNHALKEFSQQPELFKIYHEGFSSQVNKWPVNPVDEMIKYVNRQSISKVIADFGCGEAKLAASVHNTVHSFDLVAQNESVVACDISHVPIGNATVDIAIFSLALMGVNYVDFLREAHRVLRMHGILKIAEVKSRIEDTNLFIDVVSQVGFTFKSQDDSQLMFVSFEFEKTKKKGGKVKEDVASEALKPCIYKRR